jgi:hypothetical protein
MADPSPARPERASARTRDLPAWLIAVVLLLGLWVSACGIGWYCVADHHPMQHVPTMSVAAPRQPPILPSDPPPLPIIHLPATRISLELKSATASQAFAALASASKTSIRLPEDASSAPASPLSIAYKDQPFWTVLLDLSNKTGYAPATSYSNRNSLLLENNSPLLHAPHVIRGPFLLCLTSVRHTSQAGLGVQPAYQSLAITGQLYWEPTLTPFTCNPLAVVTEATDDLGQSLKSNVGNDFFPSTNPGCHQSISVALQLPPRPSHRLVRLRGYFRALHTGSKDDILEISNPLTAKPRRMTANGIPIEFESLTESAGLYTARFVAFGQYKDPRISHRFTPGIIQLLDAKGAKLQHAGGGTGSRNDTYTFSATFAAGATPARLILNVPTDLKEVRIPFDFQDIPLP